jgi:hypothetical protein
VTAEMDFISKHSSSAVPRSIRACRDQDTDTGVYGTYAYWN